jgi:transposase
MARALSDDLRKRVIEAVEGGASRRAAAERFGIAASTAVKWVRRFRETGSRAPRRPGGAVRSRRIDAYQDELMGLVERTPDLTLSEIAGHLKERHGVRVAVSTVWRFFERHGVTFKKRRRMPASSSART